MPNDIPNTTGLRHDTAPHHGAQSTTATTACTAPDASISVPHHQRNRCCAVIGRTASQTCRRIPLMAGTLWPYGAPDVTPERSPAVPRQGYASFPATDPPVRVRGAVATTLRRLGIGGCAGHLAAGYGDHPVAAAVRRTWALAMIRTASPEPAPEPRALALAG